MLKMVATPSPWLRSLARIAHGAGQIVMRHYADGTTTRTKSDQSAVTDADEQAESFILAALAHEAPGVPVIAEEESHAGRQPVVGRRFFLVDPLDGTREFISRNGECTINIAEVENHVPVRGVVYAPARSRLFLGESPGGAFEITADVETMPDFAGLRPIAVRSAPLDGLVAVASRSHRDKQTDEYLA